LVLCGRAYLRCPKLYLTDLLRWSGVCAFGQSLLAHSCRISTSVKGRNRSAGTIHGERLLSTISVSKAVTPLSATSARAGSRPSGPWRPVRPFARKRSKVVIAELDRRRRKKRVRDRSGRRTARDLALRCRPAVASPSEGGTTVHTHSPALPSPHGGFIDALHARTRSGPLDEVRRPNED
jgi:hypothetical protein